MALNIKLVEGQPEVPEKWRGIGIRTEQGPEVLTAVVPKAIEDLEG